MSTSSEPGSLERQGSNEPRMLQRRVSNNRADLSNDQQMNYLITWFNEWSDLQKDDFVPVLGETMSSKHTNVNGVTESISFLTTSDGRRRPSLFNCQISLYRGWVNSWSDDQKNYLILRLKELDANFCKKYEHFLQFGADSPIKDYFEPGIPAELDRSNPASLNTSIDETNVASKDDEKTPADTEKTSEKDDEASFEKDELDDSLEEDSDKNEVFAKDGWVDPLQPLSTIAEECSLES